MEQHEIMALKGMQRIYNTSKTSAFVFRYSGHEFVIQPDGKGVWGMVTKRTPVMNKEGKPRPGREVQRRELKLLEPEARGSPWFDVPADLAIDILVRYNRAPQSEEEHAFGSFHAGALKHMRDISAQGDHLYASVRAQEVEAAKLAAEIAEYKRMRDELEKELAQHTGGAPAAPVRTALKK